MEQSRLKLRISRMFRASFGSCRTRNLSDVMETAGSPPVRRHSEPIDDQKPLMSPKNRPFPSICKPRCPESAQPIINNSCIRVSKEALRRQKLCVSGEPTCPPASPADFYSVPYKKQSKKKKKKPKNREHRRVRSGFDSKLEAFPFSSGAGKSQDCYNVRNSWWFSSEDEDDREDETDTLFSSKTETDSSESLGRRELRRRRDRGTQKAPARRESEVGVKMADSFAVVKRSSDPYSDFRTSMVEMIVEKQIFAAKDLEKLLQCFLKLNSHHHHKIILEVFTEIWEALFCNWS